MFVLLFIGLVVVSLFLLGGVLSMFGFHKHPGLTAIILLLLVVMWM